MTRFDTALMKRNTEFIMHDSKQATQDLSAAISNFDKITRELKIQHDIELRDKPEDEERLRKENYSIRLRNLITKATRSILIIIQETKKKIEDLNGLFETLETLNLAGEEIGEGYAEKITKGAKKIESKLNLISTRFRRILSFEKKLIEATPNEAYKKGLAELNIISKHVETELPKIRELYESASI